MQNQNDELKKNEERLKDEVEKLEENYNVCNKELLKMKIAFEFCEKDQLLGINVTLNIYNYLNKF